MEKEIKNPEPCNSNIGVDPYWEVRREAFRNGYDAAESDYWKKFRREAAKDILCAILYGRYGANPEHFTMAIEIADELVRKLLEVDTLGTQQVIAGKMPQKRAEWSEEDMYIINILEYIVGKHRPDEIFKIGNKQGVSAYKICSWLESLRPQPKPDNLTEETKEYTIREDYTSAYYEQKGYSRGYADGKKDGYQEGYKEGFKAAKEYMLKFAESHFTKLKPEDEEIGSACYLKGVLDATDYHELTWEDIKTISDLLYKVDAENGEAWDYEVIEQDLPFPYGQKFYEEVLRRFRETKNK